MTASHTAGSRVTLAAAELSGLPSCPLGWSSALVPCLSFGFSDLPSSATPAQGTE